MSVYPMWHGLLLQWRAKLDPGDIVDCSIKAQLVTIGTILTSKQQIENELALIWLYDGPIYIYDWDLSP